MGLKIANNAIGKLASNRSATDTIFVLRPNDGSRFPLLGMDDYFPATIIRGSDFAIEIVIVTARSIDTLTVVRGQEGTAPLALMAGDKVELRFTSGSFANEVERLESSINNFAGQAFAAASTADAKAVAAQQSANTALARSFPVGAIVMWSGSIATIPMGWFLCNGENNTPDLRNRFVVSSGGIYNPGATGGTKDAVVVAHTHAASSIVSDPGHSHTYQDAFYAEAGGNGQFVGVGSNRTDSDNSEFFNLKNTQGSGTGISVSTSISSAGESGTDKNLPPYYALAYIMRGPY